MPDQEPGAFRGVFVRHSAKCAILGNYLPKMSCLASLEIAFNLERGSKVEGFGGRVVRLPSVLVQQLLDTGRQLLVGKWLSNKIVTTNSETLSLDIIADPRCNS